MDIPEETWSDIAGYEGYFQESSLGRVRSLDRIVPPGRKLRGRVKFPTWGNSDVYLLNKDGQINWYNTRTKTLA